MSKLLFLAGAAAAIRNGSTSTESTSCPVPLTWLRNDTTPIGICTSDLDVVGGVPEAVHEGAVPPTGIAVDPEHNIYFTYARNMEKQNYTLTKATSFTEEIPWPSEEWQNCAEGQNASTCFVNVQNVVLDSVGGWWVIDSGVPNGASKPIQDGPKIMNFNYSTGELIRNYPYPEELWYAKLQLNDIRINNTLGTSGYAFITEDSQYGSISTLDLDTGKYIRHIYNTTVTRPDDKFTSMYNGEPIRNWNGTKPSYMTSGTNGIALTSGNVYWGVKSSHRWYILSQAALIGNFTDEELLAQVEVPGNFPSEQAGFTADDRGRIYVMASEHNAMLYVDTLQSEVTDEVTAVSASSDGLVPTENLLFRTLIRSGLLQAADTACILDGYLYFSTNQQGLAPLRQYNNIDRRRGPFRSYKYWIGRGPAVRRPPPLGGRIQDEEGGQSSTTPVDEWIGQRKVSIRGRLSHFTWAWFETTMATGALAMLLSQQANTFNGLIAIGKIFFIVDVVLFTIFCGLITYRFVMNPPALRRSLHHPHESFYFGTFWVSIDFILYNTEIYGVPAAGPWLPKALEVCFWLYASCAILVVVFQYHVIFDEEELPVRDAMPAWILPAYPFLVLGPFAASLAGTQPRDSAIPIMIGGLLFNGLGWMIAFLMFGLYIARLVGHELPAAPKRPGMFVAVGPAAYTSYTLIALGMQAQKTLPRDFLGITSVPVGDIWLAVGVPAGIFFWLLSFWFFALSAVSVFFVGKTHFTMQWWSFVFPQVALCTAGITIGQVLDSRPVDWVFSIVTVMLAATWLFVAGAHIRAVIKKQILWPGVDEDFEE